MTGRFTSWSELDRVRYDCRNLYVRLLPPNFRDESPQDAGRPMSDPIKTGHERPVNLVAARMLWAAPWWAKVNEKVAAEVPKFSEKRTLEDWCDLLKPPPILPGSLRNQIMDRRGSYITHWRFGEGLVTGYAHTGSKVRQRTKHLWWVRFPHGFEFLNLGDGSKRMDKHPTKPQANWLRIKASPKPPRQ